MPQMAPILWSSMYLFFSMFLIFTLIKLSFSSPVEAPLTKSVKPLTGTKKNWQW